jgi:hypothetical protein
MSNRNLHTMVVSMLPTNKWTEIAVRPRPLDDPDPPEWLPEPGAPLTIAAATELMERGFIFKALRYRTDEVAVVVLPRKEPVPPMRDPHTANGRRRRGSARRPRGCALDEGEAEPMRSTICASASAR